MPFPFASTHYLLIDLDGVLYRGLSALDGAMEFIAWLRRRDIPFRLVTNNSTLTPGQYVEKLAHMGISVGRDEVFTSSLATALYLQQQGATGQTVHAIGEEGLMRALQDAGMILSPDGADWVVSGLDRHVTYEQLSAAALAIEAGARFVGTNPDRSLPTEVGLAPGAGALQAALAATTGVKPTVIGKPGPKMFELAMASMGSSADNTAMLGDRLDTDIEGAAAVGMASILVLTGVSTAEDLRRSDVQPGLVVRDLPELMRVWSEEPGAERPPK